MFYLTGFVVMAVADGNTVTVVVVDVEVVALAGEPQLAVVLLVVDDVNLE
jgi:hypothetical protein